jgi:hypothetical protein
VDDIQKTIDSTMVQTILFKSVLNRMRGNPCLLDLGLFEQQSGDLADKNTLAAWIVETSAMSGADKQLTLHPDNLSQAARILNLTDEEAIRLLKVTYWSEPFASACILSAYEYLDELAEYKFRFNLTETQETNCRKVLRLFAYQAIVEICALRILFFFATNKTDEVENFDFAKLPPASGYAKAEQLLVKVEYWRRLPVEKVDNILSFKHNGWLFEST